MANGAFGDGMITIAFSSGCQKEQNSRDKKANNAPERRRVMVQNQLRARGISDKQVLAAMEQVPRHEFVQDGYEDSAYEDTPLPIGSGQTISQPYVVAFMTEKLDVQKGDKVLEIGTGSGYQAAVLAQMQAQVYSIEVVEELGRRARKIFDRLGYGVRVRIGDGYKGWPEYAPFDKIIVTAAAPKIPDPLVKQLKTGGKMILPLGEFSQNLTLVTKTDSGIRKQSVLPVRFVPMTGEVRE